VSYELLMTKLSSEKIHLGPNLQDVMQRVREVGLHKVAAKLHDVPELDIKTAANILGARLLEAHLRQTKIAAGLRAYDALLEVGALPLASAR
jgi:hypothetical protein